LRKQEKELSRMETMICGMTSQERRNPHILNARRRQRIAKGSGISVAELNTMLNKSAGMQQMMKKMGISGSISLGSKCAFLWRPRPTTGRGRAPSA
jgi:signal recognition particle subunit SRP54